MLKGASDWKGVWTALITPFEPSGNIDVESLKKLIEWQISKKVTGLVIAGSTGEGSLLDDDTYQSLLRLSVDIANGRIPIVAGLGIGGTRESLSRAMLAKKAGVSGLLASPPAYIKTPQRGLVKHYATLCECGLPLCLYDVPSRSAMGLPDEVVDELLEMPSQISGRIHALKDATGKPERIQNKKIWKEKIALLSGDDESYPKFIHMGGHGIISVAGHFLLPEFRSVLSDAGSTSTPAANNFEKFVPFIRALYWESNPIPTKSLLAKIKFISNDTFQAPLVPMKEELLNKLDEIRKELGISLA